MSICYLYRFKSNYGFCVEELKKYEDKCKITSNDARLEISYNKRLEDIFKLSKLELNKLKNKYEDYRITPLYTDINELNQKNDVVDTYSTISDKLEEHYDILENTGNTEVEKFLSEVGNKNETDKAAINERKQKINTLYNKVAIYMENSINRKTQLFTAERDLLSKMKNNEEKAKAELDIVAIDIKNLESNIDKLETNNRDMLKNMSECEIVESLTSKCNETSQLYESIMNAYSQQTQNLQKIYNNIVQ